MANYETLHLYVCLVDQIRRIVYDKSYHVDWPLEHLGNRNGRNQNHLFVLYASQRIQHTTMLKEIQFIVAFVFK
jgi:hypothetical protein